MGGGSHLEIITQCLGSSACIIYQSHWKRIVPLWTSFHWTLGLSSSLSLFVLLLSASVALLPLFHSNSAQQDKTSPSEHKSSRSSGALHLPGSPEPGPRARRSSGEPASAAPAKEPEQNPGPEGPGSSSTEASWERPLVLGSNWSRDQRVCRIIKDTQLEREAR